MRKISGAYPKKTICLQDAAEVEYIPLETKDEVIFNGTVVNISRQGIAGYNKKKGAIYESRRIQLFQ